MALDKKGTEGYLTNRCVMVTGAGLFIGSELRRQIARVSPEKMVPFDADEASLYEIQMELQQRISYVNYFTVLGGGAEPGAVDKVFEKFRTYYQEKG